MRFIVATTKNNVIASVNIKNFIIRTNITKATGNNYSCKTIEIAISTVRTTTTTIIIYVTNAITPIIE